MKPRFDGATLVLPDWHFSGKDARVPRRSRTLAFHREGGAQYFVCANRGQTLFWVHAMAPGFAGERSRASHTCATRNEGLAQRWIAAVNAGNVRIE
jgi:hypothetical protein